MRFPLESVTKDEVAKFQDSLCNWTKPDEFASAVDGFRRRFSRGEFFNVPALGFLREAWTLGKFANLATAELLRLESGVFPDGHVRCFGRELAVEVTEALMADRRRGQEFLPGDAQIEEDPPHEWDRRLDALPTALNNVILLKVAKTYANPPTLLVYLNINAYDHRKTECQSVIRSIIEQHAQSFAGLFVLWGEELFGECRVEIAKPSCLA